MPYRLTREEQRLIVRSRQEANEEMLRMREKGIKPRLSQSLGWVLWFVIFFIVIVVLSFFVFRLGVAQ